MHVYKYLVSLFKEKKIVKYLQYLITHCVTNHNKIRRVYTLVTEVILCKKRFTKLRN